MATRNEPRTTGSAADVMTPEVISVASIATVTEIAEQMRDNHVGDVFVMDGKRLIGIVTDRDLVVRVIAAGLDPVMTRAGQICSEDLVAVTPHTPLEEVTRVMRERAVRRLPVVDDNGHPVGAISIGDLAAARQPTSVLADISLAPPNV
jgi:CBS domain-containing protein